MVLYLPMVGRIQPKIGAINPFPYYGSFELCLSIIMERFLLIVGFLFYPWVDNLNTTFSNQ